MYDIAQNELAGKTLEVTVWDKDIGKNDYIGKLIHCLQCQSVKCIVLSQLHSSYGH